MENQHQTPAPERISHTPPVLHTDVVPVAISAGTKHSLQAYAAHLFDYMNAHDDVTADELGHALAVTPTHLSHRAVILSINRRHLIESLAVVARGDGSATVVEGVVPPTGYGPTTFVFSGQGSQRPDMGKALYEASPLFAAAFDEACADLDPHLDHNLHEVMFSSTDTDETTLLNQTRYSQPALFALETALHRLLEQLGLKCDYVTGHSIGEIAAAYSSGALNLTSAAVVTATRGELMHALSSEGVMVAIEATEREIAESIAAMENRIAIAAVNAPRSTVLSGDRDAIVEIVAHWRSRGRRTRQLRVSHAFHSSHIDPALESLRRLADNVVVHPPRVPIVSCLTGRPITVAQLRSRDFWADQARRAVRFYDAIAWIIERHRSGVFVEIGPHPVLMPAIEQTVRAAHADTAHDAIIIGTLRNDHRDIDHILTALARSYACGALPNLIPVFAGRKVRPITYPAISE